MLCTRTAPGALSSAENMTITNAYLQVHNATAGRNGGAGRRAPGIPRTEVEDGRRALSPPPSSTAGSADSMRIPSLAGGAMYARGHLEGSGRWVLEDCQADSGGRAG